MVTSLYRSDGFTGWQRFCSFSVGIPAQPLGKLAQRSIARTFVSSFKWAIWSISGNEFLISTVDSFCELRFFGLVGRRFGPDSFVGDVLVQPEAKSDKAKELRLQRGLGHDLYRRLDGFTF